ncbi:MAG: hypothetical protein KC620_13740, partial [Myxococcales bacterium]|nr:hypothetical protein [Myxococcales bacterium]
MTRGVHGFWICALASALCACGGPKPVARGPDPCKAGEASLRQRLGPEFARIEKAQPLARADGCALVYSRVAEEMPEELPEDEAVDSRADHQLALVFARPDGRVALANVERADGEPSAVGMQLRQQEVTGDGVADLVIDVRAG